MRMTIRIVLGTMTALDNALDEITHALRGTHYYEPVKSVQRNLRHARRELGDVIDHMQGTAFGD